MAFFQWSRRSVALDYHKFPTRNLEDNLQTAQHTRTGHLLPSLPSFLSASAAGYKCCRHARTLRREE